MRTAMYYNNHDIRIEEISVPQIGRGEILMKVIASGVCGSDVLEWYRIHKAPLVLGHEVSGEIAEVGEGITSFKIGDRIVASHHVPCNTCYYCLTGHHTACDTLRNTDFDPGGFAEFIRLPSIHVSHGAFSIPDELSFEQATFHEPLGCVLRALRRADLKPGQTVLIIGCGIAGLLAVATARSLGAGKIMAVEPVLFRREAAKQFGADSALSPEEDVKTILQKMTCGRAADLVMVCTGAENAQRVALNTVERGGKVLFFAPTDPDVKIPLSINDILFRNDVTLTTSYGAAPFDSWLALQMMADKTIDVSEMITHRFPLDKTADAFRITAQASDSIKVIVQPNQ